MKFDSSDGWMAAFAFLSALFLFIMAGAIMNGGHVAACLVFGYLLILFGCNFVWPVYLINTDASHQEIIEAIHPLHHAKEWIELWLIGAAWRAVVLTRAAGGGAT
jgi:hypothetical protein